MTVKQRGLLNEIQLFNIVVSMAIIVGIAGVALAIMAFNMLQDLRQRSVATADELEAFLQYPLYAVDDAQAVRIAKTFLASDKIAGITLQSTAQGLLLGEHQEKESAWIPPIARDIRWNQLPLGQFTVTFSDEEVRATLARFSALALVVIAAVLLANIAVNRYFIAHRVKRPFDSLIAAMRHIAEGDYQTLITPTDYRDINILVDQFNDMAGRIHQKNEEQQATEDALRKSEERYRNIVETTAEWIWEMDIDGRHRYSNPGVTTILGYRPGEVMGQPAAEFLHPVDRPTVERLLPQLIAEKRGWRGWVLRWRHKDGSYRYLESNGSPILGPEGELVGYLGADRDITERRQAQEEGEQLQHQLLQLQKMEAIGTLAGGIAHDFNNMLRAIIGYAELCLDPPLNGRDVSREYMTNLLQAAHRAGEFTRRILGFSRQEGGELQPVPVTPLLKEVGKLIRSAFPATITVREVHAAENDIVLGDATQIYQVVMNLCTNAFHAMHKDGGVHTVDRTTDVFTRVVTNSSRAGDIVDEIAAAATEQDRGIQHLNAAVSEMDKVVQQNAATAEESAASADLIRNQAHEMQHKIKTLVELVFDERKNGQRFGPPKEPVPGRCAARW